MLVLLGLGLGIVLIEIALRVIGFGPGFVGPQEVKVELDPHYLFRIKGNPSHGFNSLGFRDDEFTQKSDKKRIAVIGDSFVVGAHVHPGRTFANMLEVILKDGTEVYNMGVIAYGPDQALLRFLDQGLKYEPDLVILSIFSGNDFLDLWKNQLFQIGPDGAAYNPDNPVAKAFPNLRTEILIRRLLGRPDLDEEVSKSLNHLLFYDSCDIMEADYPNSDEMKQLMKGVLARAKKEFKARGIPLLVLIVPSYDNIQDPADLVKKEVPESAYFENERLLVEFCEELDIPHLDLTPKFLEFRQDLTLYNTADRHFSADGHLAAAALLKAPVKELLGLE